MVKVGLVEISRTFSMEDDIFFGTRNIDIIYANSWKFGMRTEI